jgi:hypothetical protein
LLAAHAERDVTPKQLQFVRGIVPAPQLFPGALRAERAKAAPEWDDERWLLELAANVCVFAGFRRRSFTGVLLIIGGRILAWWATPGADPRRAHLIAVARERRRWDDLL